MFGKIGCTQVFVVDQFNQVQTTVQVMSLIGDRDFEAGWTEQQFVDFMEQNFGCKAEIKRVFEILGVEQVKETDLESFVDQFGR